MVDEYGNILRRARRDWRCHAEVAKRNGWRWAEQIPADHTPTIPRGAQYVENVESVALYQSGQRYCVPCAKAFCGYAEVARETYAPGFDVPRETGPNPVRLPEGS
jgi:hypothetical protein